MRNKLPVVDVTVPMHKESFDMITQSLIVLDTYLQDTSTIFGFKYQLTVACSACDKETIKKLNSLQKIKGKYRIVKIDRPGRGRALKSAWLSSNSDIVMYTDVDLATSTVSIEGLLRPLLDGFEGIVYGNRRLKSSKTKRSILRKTLSRLYLLATAIFINTSSSDLQCGFKAMPTDLAKRIVPQIEEDYWHFDSELLVYAQDQDIEIKPVPVEWRESQRTSLKLLRTAYASVCFINNVSKKQKRVVTPERVLMVLIFLLSIFWYLQDLTNNKWANIYYSSAIQSAKQGWKQFFFGSFDNLNFVSIDKYPMVVWPSVLSAKIFGFSQFAVLLPHALTGALTGLVLFIIVRKEFGVPPAILSWGLLILSPLGTIMYRFNNPDTYLALFALVSMFCVLKVFESNGWRWYVMSGIAFGICFQMKTLQSFLFIVPIIVVLIWEMRVQHAEGLLKRLSATSGVFLITALWWPIVVSITDKSNRPIVGGSANNNVWDLITGYNGISRLTGRGSAHITGKTSAVFGGDPGIFRMFNTSFFPNIGWLVLPAFIFSIYILSLVFKNNDGKDHSQKRLQLMLAVIFLTHVAVFSMASGKIHAYYSLAIVPTLCALIAISIVTVYSRLDSSNFKVLLWLCASTCFTIVFIIPFTLRRIDPSWNKQLYLPIIVLGIILLVSYIYMSLIQNYTVVRSIYYVTICVILATSVFSIYDTRTTPYVGYLPTALPKDAIFSKVRPLPKPDKQLFQTLNKTVSQDNWIAATENSFEASIVQLQTGRAAMALGGFDGIDFISTANQRDQYIKDGKIQFFVTSRQIAPKYEVSNIRRWVLDNSMACPHKTQWYVYALGDNPCPS